MKYILERLDIITALSCNLSCRGCISLSDRYRSGVVNINDIVNGLNLWSTILDPEVVTIFGGEPTLHPKLLDIIQQIRYAWPLSTIRLITNGYLLSNFSPDNWFKFGSFEMQVSIHRLDHESIINSKIKSILESRKDWKVKKFGQNDHKQIAWYHGSFSIYKSIFKDFIAPYGVNSKLLNYNSNPAQAHSICGSSAAPTLYKDKLYKCPAVANAVDIDPLFFDHAPGISFNDNINNFIQNIGVPEKICGNCPNDQSAARVNHFNKENVIVRQKTIN